VWEVLNFPGKPFSTSPQRKEGSMSNLWAALVCATGLWAIAGFTIFEPVKRPAGEAWVVTASEKIRSRPILVRAHVPYQTASVQ